MQARLCLSVERGAFFGGKESRIAHQLLPPRHGCTNSKKESFGTCDGIVVVTANVADPADTAAPGG